MHKYVSFSEWTEDFIVSFKEDYFYEWQKNILSL